MRTTLLILIAGLLMASCITGSKFRDNTKIPDGFYHINGGQYRGLLRIHRDTAIADIFAGEKFATFHSGDTLYFNESISMWRGRNSTLTQKNKAYLLHTSLKRGTQEIDQSLKVSKMPPEFSDSAVLSWLNSDKNSAALSRVEGEFFQKYGVTDSTLSRVHTFKEQYGIKRDARNHNLFLIELSKLRAALMDQ